MDKNGKNKNEYLHPWEKILLDRPLNLAGWNEFERKGLYNWKLPNDFLSWNDFEICVLENWKVPNYF